MQINLYRFIQTKPEIIGFFEVFPMDLYIILL